MYIIKKDNKIMLADADYQRLYNTVAFMPELEDLPIEEVADEELEQGYDGGWHFKGQAPEKPSEIRIEEIKARLSAIDQESLRPLRAIAQGVATDYDSEKLATLEAEAVELRAELASL